MRDDSEKSAAISVLTKQIDAREKELQRLRADLNKIPRLEDQINMLQGSLAMIRGADIAEKGKAPAQLSLTNGASSLSSTVYKILKQAGKPLGPKEIVLLGPTNGRTINYQSLTGLMAGKIKQGKQFYREGSGKNSKYGLLELKPE